MPPGLTTRIIKALDAKGGEANSCFSPVLYKSRNAIERMFCRIKDFRRIATRYDKLADNFLASVHLVAALIWWL